jgi:hypothetical protein
VLREHDVHKYDKVDKLKPLTIQYCKGFYSV